jgi:type II secretion system protein H
MKRPRKNSVLNHYSKRFRETGFTLIEIIVVVAIIAVMVAYVGVSMGGDGDRMANLEAKRFKAVVNEVRDEAILSGESFILMIDERSHSYQFESVRGRQKTISGGGLLRLRKLEAGVELRWEVFEQIDDDEDIKPRVLITPLGEITPFSTSFLGEDNAYLVFIDENGQLARRVDENILF